MDGEVRSEVRDGEEGEEWWWRNECSNDGMMQREYKSVVEEGRRA